MWAPLVASPLTWRCISFANAGFWGMSSFCSALDHLAPSAYRRIQGDKSLLTSSEWLHVAALAAVNMTVVSYMASLGFEVLTTALHGRLPLETDPFVWYLQAPRLAACVVIVDLWFYWTHRALHWPPLYRTVHKIHHRFTAPCAVVAVYAHPLEFALGNLAAVALGPVLTNAHPYTAYLWFFFALVQTCASHSGYYFLDAKKHDDHHRLFNCNYGVGPLCDWLFGTSATPDEQQLQKQS